MPLPDSFNSTEFLQDAVRQGFNREVREYFADLGGEDWDEDISNARGSLRVACTHRDTDNVLETILRLLLFRSLNEENALPTVQVFGGTSEAPKRRHKPKIILIFTEDPQDVEPGYSAITGEITFRLMDETSESITNAKLTTIANRIKTVFGASNGYRWRKGKKLFSYSDWDNGYQLQLLCTSKTEAQNLVRAVLDIKNDTPQWKCFNTVENESESEKYPVIPERAMILGKSRRLPRYRPVGYVRFRYALAEIWGIPNPIVLYDRTGTQRNPLVT